MIPDVAQNESATIPYDAPSKKLSWEIDIYSNQQTTYTIWRAMGGLKKNMIRPSLSSLYRIHVILVFWTGDLRIGVYKMSCLGS